MIPEGNPRCCGFCCSSTFFLIFLITCGLFWGKLMKRAKKASSTLRASRAVPHPGTDRALRRLTSEFGRDPVHSTRYGRWREGKVTFKDARAPPWRIRCFWDPWQMGGSLLPGLALRRRRGPLPVRFAAWTQSVNSCGYSARTHDSCASGDRYEI